YDKIDKRGKKLVNSQQLFCEEAQRAIPKTVNVYQERVFIPAEPVE
ncbi:MAG: polyphosphate kinase, partial [Lachnospiraceae bacterium]|nr:polyphosphate kinase [Lachnospiraceae bacterium]